MNTPDRRDQLGILTVKIRRVGGPLDGTTAEIETGPHGLLTPLLDLPSGQYEPTIERDGDVLVYRWHEGTFDLYDRIRGGPILSVAHDPAGGLYFLPPDQLPPATPPDQAKLRGDLRERLISWLAFPPDAAERWIDARLETGDPTTWAFWIGSVAWVGDQLKLPAAERERPS